MSAFKPNFEEFHFQEELDLGVDHKTRGLLSDIHVFNPYQWNHEYVNPLAMVDGIPASHFPTMKWGLQVAKSIVDVVRNNRAVSVEMNHAQTALFNQKLNVLQDGIDRNHLPLRTLVDVVSDITTFGQLTEEERPQSVEDYAKLFKTIELPAIASDYNLDSTFATMRTAGPNPLLIKRLTTVLPNFPMTKAQYRKVMSNDTLEAALKEGRLYICDYALLTTQEANPTAPHKCLYAPIALFAVDKKTQILRPVAIQCQQVPSAMNPIYIADNSHDWLIAKTIVEMADANHHEAVSHLGRTHLYIEPFVVATCRNFSKKHAIYRLLMPHFEGTLFINYAAVKVLVAENGAVDHLLQGTLQSTLEMSVKGIQEYPVEQSFLPKVFAQNDTNDLKNYAFRDDATLYWNAIKQWVTNYLQQQYEFKADVTRDPELLAWYNDLVSENGGRVQGLSENGKPIQTLERLIEVLTLIIYTSSVQHAAVNFPQFSLMSYSPKTPFACYDTFPKMQPNGAIQPSNPQRYLDLLPNKSKAQEQINLLATLSGVYYTQLGAYPANQFDTQVNQTILPAFQDQIKQIGHKIKEQNLTRRPYNTLLPQAIPQSINI